MSYFKNFGYIQYDYTIKSDPVQIQEVIVDLSQRILFNISDEQLAMLCEDVVIRDNMSPEMVAYYLYEDPLLHWTILYVNNITDLHSEWPITQNALNDFVTRKYGAGNENAMHHYEKLPEGIIMDKSFLDSMYPESEILPVSNYLYEDMLNESKRHIKVIKKEHIVAFVSSFNKANNV